MIKNLEQTGKQNTMPQKFKELYALPGAASNFISYMALYGEPTDLGIVGQKHNVSNEYDIWREKSKFVFTENLQRLTVKRMHLEGKKHCWHCGFPNNTTYKYGNSLGMWLQDKLRHEYPKQWGKCQAFLAGKKPWFEDFVEKYKDEPNHNDRVDFLKYHWDLIGIYDVTMYITSFLGYEDEMDKWIAKCINLRYAIAIDVGLEPYVITHFHPLTQFKYLKMPDAIKFDTMAISIDKDEDIELVNAIHYRKRPEVVIIDEMNKLSIANKKFSDRSIDYRDLFIEPKKESIRELYDFFDNVELFDSKPNYIISKFKSYHEINLGLLEDAKSR